jgi:hypothetical protein
VSTPADERHKEEALHSLPPACPIPPYLLSTPAPKEEEIPPKEEEIPPKEEEIPLPFKERTIRRSEDARAPTKTHLF